MKLTYDIILEQVTDIEKLVPCVTKKDKSAPNDQTFQACIDGRVIKAFIVNTKIEDIKSIYSQENFAAIFADKIGSQFMDQMKMCDVDVPLEKGEIPVEFLVHKKF
jgi:hypothetical protein